MSFDPAVLVLRNVLEYLDRAGTWPLPLLIAACVATRTRPGLDDCRRVSISGGAWFVLAAVLTPFSGQVIDAPRAINTRMTDGRVVVIRDGRAVRPNFGEVFFETLLQRRG